MLKITQIKVPIDKSENKRKNDLPDLTNEISRLLHIKKDRIISWKVLKRSIEARKKERLSYVYTVTADVKNEAAVLKSCKSNNVTKYVPVRYNFPNENNEEKKELSHRPVIVGSGPAGMICGYLLAKYGYRPLILERGEKIEDRTKTVSLLWDTGDLNSESNVQFGEGGAGAFSDGKLNTGVNDKFGRNAEVLRIFVEAGAPEQILYDAMPHVGTDKLYDVVRNIRKFITDNGGEYIFNACVTDILTENDHICGVKTSSGDIYLADICILATGHSARDTMHMLYNKQVKMHAKAFAAGVRISHSQEMINISQWGSDYPKSLGAAAYKLTAKLKDDRSAYTFCMCPGGYVVNASSENGHLAVNGMSYSGRDSGYANSAVIVSVNPEDYLRYKSSDLPDELSAISFQRMLEKNAYNAADGMIPVQRFEDFCNGSVSKSNGFEPCTKGKWAYANASAVFPEFLRNDICEGILSMGERIKEFNMPDALIYAVESRTSSPVRIERDEKTLQSNLKGLIPCGEGAGYAGGITSAGIDGIKAAEAVARIYRSIA